MPRNSNIKFRKGLNSEWVSQNPTLASGEPAFETDTLRLKIGNGTTAWSGLNYVGLAGTGTSGYLPKFNSSQGVTNSLIYDNGTNIGIGTTTPSKKLDVIGDVRISGVLNIVNVGDSSDRSISVTNNNMTFASVHGIFDYSIGLRGSRGSACGMESNATNGYLALAAGGSEKVRIATDGKVGIGTTAPSSQLHIIGSGIFSSGIIVGDSSTNGYIYGPSGNANIQFNNGGTNRIDITATNLFFSASTYLGGTTYANGTLTFPKTSTPTSIATQSNPNELRFYNGLWNGSSTYDGYNTLHSIASTSVSGASRFALLMNNGDGTQGRTERLSVLSNGNVGIGTITPSGFLDVAGDVYVRGTGNNLGTVYFKSTSAASDTSLKVRADTNGNLYLDAA